MLKGYLGYDKAMFICNCIEPVLKYNNKGLIYLKKHIKKYTSSLDKDKLYKALFIMVFEDEYGYNESRTMGNGILIANYTDPELICEKLVSMLKEIRDQYKGKMVDKTGKIFILNKV